MNSNPITPKELTALEQRVSDFLLRFHSVRWPDVAAKKWGKTLVSRIASDLGVLLPDAEETAPPEGQPEKAAAPSLDPALIKMLVSLEGQPSDWIKKSHHDLAASLLEHLVGGPDPFLHGVIKEIATKSRLSDTTRANVKVLLGRYGAHAG